MSWKAIGSAVKRIVSPIKKVGMKYPRSTIGAVSVLSAVLAYEGGRHGFQGETLFDGRIGDHQVTYEEGIAKGYFLDSQNRMTIKTPQGFTYTLYDQKGDTPLDTNHILETSFKDGSELERISISGPRGSFDFTRDYVNPQTLVGARSPEAFKRGDETYRKTREAIRTHVYDRNTADLDASLSGFEIAPTK